MVRKDREEAVLWVVGHTHRVEGLQNVLSGKPVQASFDPRVAFGSQRTGMSSGRGY